ncbi:ubiquitin carboxyl-terminal hydrolase [Acanthopleuribacter pedis]|uniref:USP domain-containing protein n=1 Tax=Acanthopleuribacter pedis TaxID=442870 RepID=A0A8J7QA88_9BACT|nr:ubiquitin carboxyl-terminal hydrolase family protein [Acanthopleuribacter pedis]MBO1321676.1 hypothetical protein [Acanthopleuribacter pedis]
MTVNMSAFRKVMNTSSSRIVNENGNLASRPKGTWGQYFVSFYDNRGVQSDIKSQNRAVRNDFIKALKQDYGDKLANRIIKRYHLNQNKSQPLSSTTIKQVIKATDKEFLKPMKQEFRQIIANAPRDRIALIKDKTFPRKLEHHLNKMLGPYEGKQRQAILNELREQVNGLPGYFPKFVREKAHDIIDTQDRQVGAPGWGYLGPSKAGDDDEHVMNRGIAEVVMIGKEPYTPIYMSVYGDALTSSKPSFKDVGQDEDGRILIHTGNKKDDEGTLWVSMGRPHRQVKWLENYSRQGNIKGHQNQPLIRSFLVPLHIANEISADCITEHNSKGSGKDMSVDKHYEANQYGIVNPRSLEKLRQHALPGSLKTYTDGPLDKQPKNWGDVVPVSDLRMKLGVPDANIPGIDIFTEVVPSSDARKLYAILANDESVLFKKERLPKGKKLDKKRTDLLEKFLLKGIKQKDLQAFLKPWATSGGKNKPDAQHLRNQGVPDKTIKELEAKLQDVGFIEKSSYKDRADELLTIYAYHTGNEEYLPDGVDWGNKQSRKLLVDNFCNKHQPKKVSRDDFINDYVGPWATQARISQEISENFDELREEQIDSLPREAPLIEFSRDEDLPIVGRAWPKETKLSLQTQELLEQRYQLRKGLRDLQANIDTAFKDKKGVQKEARRILGPMKNRIGTILNDYNFKIGKTSHLKTAMPGYQMELMDYRDGLAALLPKTNPPKALVDIIATLDRAIQGSKTELKDQLSLALQDIGKSIKSRQGFMADSSNLSKWNALSKTFGTAAAKLDGKAARQAFDGMIRLFSQDLNSLITKGQKEFRTNGKISKETQKRLDSLPRREQDYAKLQIVQAKSSSKSQSSKFYQSGVHFRGKTQSLEKTSKVTQTGIHNTGNSCYLAAGLNMLSSVEPYRQLFNPQNFNQVNYVGKPTQWAAVQNIGPKVWAIMEDVRAGRSVDRDTINDLLATMDRYHLLPAPSLAAMRMGQTARTAQQDPNEVIFRKLIPLFDPNNSMSLNQRIVTDFTPHLDQAVQKPNLNTVDHTDLVNGRMVQNQMDPIIELPIRNRHGEIDDLEDAFDAFQDQETIDGVRANHNQGVIESRANRTLTVQGTPPAVTFTLRRGDGLEKDDHEVEAPQRMQINNVWYSLKAVVNHEGASLNSGHYTALTVNPNSGSWEHRDDSSVSSIKTPDETSESNQSQKNRGYMFTYVRE